MLAGLFPRLGGKRGNCSACVDGRCDCWCNRVVHAECARATACKLSSGKSPMKGQALFEQLGPGLGGLVQEKRGGMGAAPVGHLAKEVPREERTP